MGHGEAALRHLPCLWALTSSAGPVSELSSFLQSFPEKELRSKCHYCQGHLCPLLFYPFPQLVPSPRPLSSLNRHRAGKGRKTPIFYVFCPFLQGQSWEQPGNHRVLCKERKLMGKGCARQIPAAVPAGCTCQAAQANPGAPGKVTFTGFLGFSGIHTPGRSWGRESGARCGSPGCDGDKLGILRAVWKHGNIISMEICPA